ncbi:hypothetical protein TRIATDRAFT_77763 [Trichoderma atroviride IMI 206040]|uniref:Ams2/SPT21 N-terminal domain-containing protein n=1 Tax=Hypocrea atroviridis (strain ATCC 20476 / IMI 206040) TaxID=452589 RepID=G9P872_HYPAI|nr:uncharacterized protein TRIATDRAFT_77763 [Trichoderma atroviride IMI 206040]EHK41705.1 hypothetical protein TRIATDRAFT_77763 [Trichoderma atroviride IMI 206040]
MASPMPAAQSSNPPAAGEVDEYGLQTKFMNLKVHYTFDKEAKVNCLARGSQPLQVQTIPIDETNTIGVVDLRACIHVIAECSPELTSHECDYTIYAVDYSEPDLPQVGQGLLSWVFQSMRPDFGHHQPKMVTGRVTRNILGVFGGGGKETLEIRLKLSETARIQRSIAYTSPPVELNHIGPMEPTLPPNAASEWNSLVQSNPQTAPQATQNQGPVQSLMQSHSPSMAPALPQGPPPPLVRQGSFGPSYSQIPPTQELPRLAPTPVDPQSMPSIPAPSSRPSSRASNRPPRRKPPTGRPRGRPRKKPAEGNTSGYEDGTEGEDAAPPKENEPVKKRAKITKVDRSDTVAFGAEPESLRVAASNSSSLRNFRPIGINNDSVTGSHHLQEIPRAPTPVPNGRLRVVPPGREPSSLKRRESALSQPPTSGFATSDVGRFQSPGIDDDRTPESLAPTPNYPDDSPPDIGSSPPVQQATPYMRSSPPPSSPVLPPMPPMAAHESEVPNNDAGDIFGEGEPPMVDELPPPPLINKMPTQSVPIQVFQLQDGPSGQDLVHLRTYNTPYPTSNAPAPSESSLLPPLSREPSRPQSSGQPTKRKRPQSSSPPDLGPTPPPTTDAVERAMSPTLTSTPVPIQAPTPIPLPASNYATSTSAPIYAPIPTTAPFLAPGVGAPTPPAPAPESVPATAPTPELSQAPPLTDDSLYDPIVQLASTFSSREEAPPPIQQPSRSSQPPQPKPQTSSKPKYPRQLSRSQSAGPLILPTSDPIGPSALSQPPTVPLERPSTMGGGGADIRRPASTGPLALPMPEPLAEPSKESALEASCTPSDFPPPSSPQRANNKNNGKKHAIRQRLEAAINNGEMPPYCSNCGAIETPTWRKIWNQHRDGIPDRCEFSEKPGKVTAVEITQCDDEGKPTAHRVIKKSLAITDDKTKWQEALLCNPCGIWLTKCKSHRPADRWDKDASRIGQERRKRDALEPPAPSSPKMNDAFSIDSDSLPRPENAESQEYERSFATVGLGVLSRPGSTHSRGNGTAQSPIDIDTEFDQVAGSTKRLLFPSPRKDGVPKVLCDVDINIVQTAECRSADNLKGDQENAVASGLNTGVGKLDDLEALFNSPAAKERPSTPPPEPKSAPAEPFKTPTRPTPSHRPITRSVSRSMRSAKSILSPSQLATDRTPTKTPKSMLKIPGSSARRRSPRGHQSHFDSMFTSPIAQNIVQFLSQGNTFSFEDGEIDFGNLAGDNDELLDLGHLLSTDDIMPSSPPKDATVEFEYEGDIGNIADWMDHVTRELK